MMSILIDKLLKDDTINSNTEEIDGKWFIAKPIPYYGIFDFAKFKDAWRIIICKSHAYHYKQDE